MGCGGHRVFLNEENQAVQGYVQQAWKTPVCLGKQKFPETLSLSGTQQRGNPGGATG